MLGHKRVWINSLGAEWTNEVILGSTRRYATEFYQPLTLESSLFASAYGLVQRAPEFIFDGDKRVAEYDVLTETAGVDLGWTVRHVRRDPRRLQVDNHRRGDPTVADNPILHDHQDRRNRRPRAAALGHARQSVLPAPRRCAPTPRSSTATARRSSSASRSTTTTARARGHSSTRRGRRHASTVRSTSTCAAAAITNARAENLITDFNLGGFLQLSGLRTNQLSGNYMGFARARRLPPDRQPADRRPRRLSRRVARGRQRLGDSRDAHLRARGLITAGSVFLAADTWLGPFYVAWGYASGGQSQLLPVPWPAIKRTLDCSPRCLRCPPATRGTDNQRWLARSRAAVWHPCTQMKVHETLPLVPIARGEGAWLYDFDGPPLSRRRELVVGQPLRPLRTRASTPRCARSSTRSPHVLLAGFTHRPVVELSERLAALAPHGPRPRVLRLRRRVGHRDRAQDELPLLAQSRLPRQARLREPRRRAITARRWARLRSPTSRCSATRTRRCSRQRRRALSRPAPASVDAAAALDDASRPPSRDDGGADRRAARAGRVRHDDVRRRLSRAGARDHGAARRAPDRRRDHDGLRAHRDACSRGSRRARPRPTSCACRRASPAATCRCPAC